MIIPNVPDLSSLPVVIIQHGLPATKRFGLEIGNTFARLGMAVIAVDMFLMGARAASAVDEVSELRGLAVPDGIHEHNDIGVNLAVLGVGGAEAGREADPAYHFATASQMIVDLLSTVRFVRDGNLDAARAADASLSTLSFDRDRVFYVGESYGGYLGMSALPILDGVAAAALVVGGPDAFDSLVNSPHNRPSIEIVTTTYLGLRGAWETAGRRLTMSPVLNLWRWAFEPISGANALHYAFDAPIGTAQPPDALFIFTDCDEFSGSAAGENALGLAGVPVGGAPLRLVSAPSLVAPTSANRETPNGTVTAAGYMYVANHAVLRLRSVTIEHEKPIEPPFTLLAEPRPHDNPIEEAHAQIAELFRSRAATGRGVVIDPFTD
jgi:pimeloyl-ACP methyl ester carboxylesterase